MNNLENIVQIALSAYDIAWRDERPPVGRDDFELELRRLLMQAEPQVQLKPVGPLKRDGKASVTIRASPMHTYTVNPPNLMGTWTTGGVQTSAMGIPPASKPEILHG
jgi:hypothetical protein